MLDQSKRAWDSDLKFSLWVDKISTKRSIGASHFQLVYGIGVIFPIHMGVLVMNLLQEDDGELDPSQRRNHQIVEVQQLRDKVLHQNQVYQDKIKATFDRHAQARDIQLGYYVFKWDERREGKGQHGKIDNIWLGPFIVTQVVGNNTYHISTVDDEQQGSPINGRFLKLFFKYWLPRVIATLYYMYHSFL